MGPPARERDVPGVCRHGIGPLREDDPNLAVAVLEERGKDGGEMRVIPYIDCLHQMEAIPHRTSG
jgi:hypothetical protein